MVDHLVDRQSEKITAGQPDHQQSRILRIVDCLDIQDPPQRAAAHPLPEKFDQQRIARLVEFQRLGFDADDFLDIGARNAEALRAHLDGQGGNDAERRRQADHLARALAGLAGHPDIAAKAFDIGADHVHADAPPGDRCHFLCRRNTRLEDQRNAVLLRHFRAAFRRHYAGRDRAVDQSVRVDTQSVVGDRQDDAVAGLPGRNMDPADLALASGQPHGRLFDAVIDRVAQDVHQRIAEQFDQFAVEFDLPALDLDGRVLAELRRQIADQPRQGREQMFQPLHPHPRDILARVVDNRRQPFEGRADHRIDVGMADRPGQFVANQDDIRNPRHHPVEQRHRQPHRTRRPHHILFLVLPRLLRHQRIIFAAVLGVGLQREDKLIVAAGGEILARVDRVDHRDNPVDRRQHRADQPVVGRALAGADLGQRPFGGVPQFLDARQVEKAAAALDGMDETENRIEPLAIGRIGLPRHQLALHRLQHLARFGDKFRQQIVHIAPPRLYSGH